jgi:hypothetical protein
MAFGDYTPKNAGRYRRKQPTLTAGKMGVIGVIAILTILALTSWLVPPLVSWR